MRSTSADNATRMPWTSGPPRSKRPGFRYGQGIRDASLFSGRSSSCVTRQFGQRRRVALARLWLSTAPLWVWNDRLTDEMVAQARKSIQEERKIAVAQLRAEVADLAVAAASRIVKSSLDEKTQRQLVDEYIKDLPAGRA